MLDKKELQSLRDVSGEFDPRLPQLFDALSDTGRFKILKLLMEYEDLCVTDIANVLEISVPAASQQLKILELSGLITKERDGQMICYSIREGDSLVKSVLRLVV